MSTSSGNESNDAGDDIWAEHDRMRAGRIKAGQEFRRAREGLQLAYIVFAQKLAALENYGLPEFSSEIERLAAIDAEAEEQKMPPPEPKAIEINVISRNTETIDEMVVRLEKFQELSIEEMGAEMKRLGIPELTRSTDTSWPRAVYELRKAIEQAASLELVHDWRKPAILSDGRVNESITLAPVMDGRISESDALKKYMQDAARASARKNAPTGLRPDEDSESGAGMNPPKMS